MVQHHEVVLTADAGLLVSTESGVSWVVVVLVDPNSTSLDCATCTINGVLVTAPDTSAEAVVGVVCDADSLIEVAEGSNRKDWSEDFLAEDPHVVGAAENGWLNVVTVLHAINLVDLATSEGFSAFFWADLQVGGDLVHLLLGRLSTHHGFSIKWVTQLDVLNSLHAKLEEFISDGLMNKCTGRTGTNFTLVEGEHREAFNCLLCEGVIL